MVRQVYAYESSLEEHGTTTTFKKRRTLHLSTTTTSGYSSRTGRSLREGIAAVGSIQDHDQEGILAG